MDAPPAGFLGKADLFRRPFVMPLLVFNNPEAVPSFAPANTYWVDPPIHQFGDHRSAGSEADRRSPSSTEGLSIPTQGVRDWGLVVRNAHVPHKRQWHGSCRSCEGGFRSTLRDDISLLLAFDTFTLVAEAWTYEGRSFALTLGA